MRRRILQITVALLGLGLVGVGIGAGATAAVDGGDYVVYAKFDQAGPLREGFKVRINGAPVGTIDKLDLDAQDNVVAKLKIDANAAPVGRDARATARAADLLGEKFVDLDRGNVDDPAPSGLVIPPDRTALAVEVDDLINAIDLPTRKALRVFLAEQGAAYVGRGRDLAATLAALPSSLDRTGALLAQLATDNRALARLVEQSDRVVGSIAHERRHLGRLVGAAGATLDTLGERRRELGTTVREAPATLVSARRALDALEGAAIPLAPAARGLAATAPRLTATLNELPAFAAAARPTLRTVRRVAPSLQTLGRRGAPVVRRLRPLTGELDKFAGALDPVTHTLDTGGMADLLGVMEGWARATQARDTASHLFRFGATVGAGTVSSLLTPVPEKPEPTSRRRAHAPSLARSPLRDVAETPKLRVPTVPKLDVRPVVDGVRKALPLPEPGAGRNGSGGGGGVPIQPLLDYLLGP